MIDTTQAAKILDRIKRLDYYEVAVTFPSDLKMSGKVPFHMEIEGDNAIFTVLAESEDEAVYKVFEYLNGLDI